MSFNLLDILRYTPHMYTNNGRSVWLANTIVTIVNSCGKFSPLQYKTEAKGEIFATWEISEEYSENTIKKVADYFMSNQETNTIDCTTVCSPQYHTGIIRNITYRAYATEKNTGKRLKGSLISIKMAVDNGWYFRNRRWQIMPEILMQLYSAVSFARFHIPELVSTMLVQEELDDLGIETLAFQMLDRRY